MCHETLRSCVTRKLSVFHIDGGFKTADFHESSEYGIVRTS